MSPLLWKKVRPKLSAGRVQSVAVRLVVERADRRLAFVPASWWDAKVASREKGNIDAELWSLGAVRLASGRDFGEDGKLSTKREVRVLQADEAQALVKRLTGKPARCRGRGKALHRPTGGSLHHIHAPAGSQPQAPVHGPTHHVHGPASVRKRLDYLHAEPTPPHCRARPSLQRAPSSRNSTAHGSCPTSPRLHQKVQTHRKPTKPSGRRPVFRDLDKAKSEAGFRRVSASTA